MVSRHESSFGVCDRHVDVIDAPEKDVAVGGDLESNPAGGVLAVVVPGERGIGAGVIGIVRVLGSPSGLSGRKDSGFQQHLEPVADAQDQFVVVEEPSDGFGELSFQLAREDDSGSDIVTVAEATGDAEHLVLVEYFRLVEHSEQVNSIGIRLAVREGVGGFHVAVGAGGTQHADAGSCHGSLLG